MESKITNANFKKTNGKSKKMRLLYVHVIVKLLMEKKSR